MKTALIAQSPTIAKVIQITPKFKVIPNKYDKMTRQTTVQKIDVYIVYLTSPQALKPLERAKEMGHNSALKILCIKHKTIINWIVSFGKS